MNWSWQDEPVPVAPQGVIGVGDAARALLAAWERVPDGAGLLVSATAHAVLLTGPATQLPWAIGVQYVAPRADAAGLWLPTAERPDLALELLERALRRQYGLQPLLLLRSPALVLPLHRLLPARPEVVAQIRQHWEAA
ncbi:hypothetical protein [Xanthomonas phaseoli]|uniref:MoxR-vWA-beta-propeller ternary system domain-containing protein n=4 Tax=Xanthomonas TaxID=338 RepID=A0A8I2BSD8_XANMN|nr:hypothetical protein [Xanthomonas phaseoli]KUF29329.1 hypothetical protein AO826_00760 [Xanthomonas phaseoli pv. manihotis]MBO9719841.1 hypothetical protein [Xanthomonas phaseoli pv. manihotis]MBO9754694.1 hypothetical protein [Xanthomonas phaseoli pv. manihotis]MBO9758310.1 hypothetical protein [Xanthomonas phaseoli pv. manihotis]MBO9764587.1 hypothetical protein [Xanthomonas phaseoli pv. manihotis]